MRARSLRDCSLLSLQLTLTLLIFFFFFNDTAPTEIYTLSLHDALPILFQTFISRHNSNFFSDKLVLTSVTPASSAPVLQTPKATSSTLYFHSLTVNAGNGGFLHCIQMDTSVNAANQVVSVGAEIGRAVQQECRDRFRMTSSA